MCEKLTDHKTTVDVGMFNSCFHLEPASQDGDILEVNLCRPHYLKYLPAATSFSTFSS
jgi:hypothetical protein